MQSNNQYSEMRAACNRLSELAQRFLSPESQSRQSTRSFALDELRRLSGSTDRVAASSIFGVANDQGNQNLGAESFFVLSEEGSSATQRATVRLVCAQHSSAGERSGSGNELRENFFNPGRQTEHLRTTIAGLEADKQQLVGFVNALLAESEKFSGNVEQFRQDFSTQQKQLLSMLEMANVRTGPSNQTAQQQSSKNSAVKNDELESELASCRVQMRQNTTMVEQMTAANNSLRSQLAASQAQVEHLSTQLKSEQALRAKHQQIIQKHQARWEALRERSKKHKQNSTTKTVTSPMKTSIISATDRRVTSPNRVGSPSSVLSRVRRSVPTSPVQIRGQTQFGFSAPPTQELGSGSKVLRPRPVRPVSSAPPTPPPP